MADKIRVTVWNEFRHERNVEEVKAIYPNGIHGAIAEFLSKDPTLEVRTVCLDDPEQGLPDEVLNNTDVLMWWGHKHHDEVKDELAKKILTRVEKYGMGFIPMHSAHYSKPFVRLMGTACELTFGPARPEIIWNLMPSHPIAAGLPNHFLLNTEELFSEPFHIPTPDEWIFGGWFKNGYIFRSGCAWYRGLGRIFYFQPGHEYCRSFYNEYVQQILTNAVHWAAPTKVNIALPYEGFAGKPLTEYYGI